MTHFNIKIKEMTIKQKFDRIDQSKLEPNQVNALKIVVDFTENFKTKDKEKIRVTNEKLDNIIGKLQEKNPNALKPIPSQRKTTNAKSSSTKTPKRNVFSVAKEIKKAGESFEEAKSRASAQIKKEKEEANKTIKTEMQKLQEYIKAHKELQGISGTDLGRDASRVAKQGGSRISKNGNIYYENRENRKDRLAPNYPKNAPLLANGGGLNKVMWQDVEIGDSARVKEINRMGLVVKNYGRKFHLKFPNGTEKTFDASDLEFFKLEKDQYEMAKGGIIITKIKDIPNLKDKVENGEVTYRGLGAGKLADDFYRLAGQNGTRIKVDGKEYFITDDDFRELNWDFQNNEWLNKIRFNAPARRYEDGGEFMTDPNFGNFQSGVYADGGSTEKYKVGQKFYDTRYDRVCEIVPSSYDGLVTWKRYNKSGTEFENDTQHSLVENQFDYLVNMGAYQISKQSMANGGEFMTDPNFGNFQNQVYARGGYVSKGELVWRKLSNLDRSNFLYENFTPEITPMSQELLIRKDFNFLPKKVKIKMEAKYANVEDYAKGGDLKGFSDNQLMIMNQNVQIEHHHEELEDVLENKTEVPAWVVAKMATATQSISDITHYLDGEKELLEEEEEELMGQDDDEEVIVNEIGIPMIKKTELTKKFTEDALGNLKGFLQGKDGIELEDDYTFEYKGKNYEIEPVINYNEKGISNAMFIVYNDKDEQVGEINYSNAGGKQNFTANSSLFNWNNTKFEDGGYFDGAIPKVSTYMSNYANGGEVAKAEIFGLKRNIMGTTDIEMKIAGMRKPQSFIVYPINKDDSADIITIQSQTRIGKIDLSTGRGLMSQSHANGAYYVHLQMDKKTPFTISESDLEKLKMQIFKTAGDNVGSRGIVTDNSGASKVFARGGGFREHNGRKYDIGRNWTKDHNYINKSEKHEMNYNKKQSMAKGGLLTPKERYILEIKGLTGLRVTAIESYIEENELSNDDVLNIVIGLGRRQLKGSDVATAVVGKKGNSASKKLIDFAKGNEALKMAVGGVMATDLAGHTSGSMGTNTPSLLSGYSGTYYDGLTGETGAMSSGEMFARGGSIKGYVEITNPNTELFQKGYAVYGGDAWETFADVKKAFPDGLPKGAFVVKMQNDKVPYFTIAEKQNDKYNNGGNIKEYKPYVFYFYYDENEMTFNTLEKALLEAKRLGVMKVRDNLGGEYFVNYANGGSLPDGVQQSYVNYYLGSTGVLAGGGVIDISLNKKVYDLAKKKKFLMNDYLNDNFSVSEYNIILAQALVESLTDANFHSEAKEVVAKLEKQDWSDDLYNSKYYNADQEISEFGRDVARICDYDGDDIINAYYNLAKTQGSSVGNLIDKLFLSKSGTTSNQTKTSTDWWNTVVNPNEDFNNFDDKMPIDWEVDDFKSWVVSKSDLDGNVDKEVLDVVKMPKAKLTVDYLNKNGSGKNNNEYYKKFGNWQSALYDIFTQMKKDYEIKTSFSIFEKIINESKSEEDAFNKSREVKGIPLDSSKAFMEKYDPNRELTPRQSFSKFYKEVKGNTSKSKKYIDHDDIVFVNIKKGSKQLTYKGVDVLNGANILEKGGQLEKIANYIPIRNVISVDLKDGTQGKPSNGYWIKKDAKPYIVGKLGTYEEGGEVEEAIINKDGIKVKSVAQPKNKPTEAEWIAKYNESKEARTYKSGGNLSKYSQFIQDEFTASKKLANKFSKKYDLPFLVLVEKGNGNVIYVKEVHGFYAFPQSYIDAHDVLYITPDAMAFGGFFGKKQDEAPKEKEKDFSGKEVITSDGVYVIVLTQYKDTALVKEIGNQFKDAYKIDLKKIQTPENMKMAQGGKVNQKMATGGQTKKGGIANRGGIMLLAKQIRKENESWKDALKRAGEQLRN